MSYFNDNFEIPKDSKDSSTEKLSNDANKSNGERSNYSSVPDINPRHPRRSRSASRGKQTNNLNRNNTSKNNSKNKNFQSVNTHTVDSNNSKENKSQSHSNSLQSTAHKQQTKRFEKRKRGERANGRRTQTGKNNFRGKSQNTSQKNNRERFSQTHFASDRSQVSPRAGRITDRSISARDRKNSYNASGLMSDFFSNMLKDKELLSSYFARTIILIPTYNERENIARLISNIHALYPEIYILVIDDSSPDGTAEVVRELGRHNRKILLLDKGTKAGIGVAYIRGFLYTIELSKGLSIDYVVQMDADFSHDPVYLTPMISAIRETDWVIGSRYAQGVNVVNWPMKRILLSFFANQYVNFITRIGISDATAGFKVFRLSVLKQINLQKVISNGYVFQIEMNYILKRLGFKVKEIPIIFRDRQVGDSKINGRIVREAMIKVLWFPFKSLKQYRRR